MAPRGGGVGGSRRAGPLTGLRVLQVVHGFPPREGAGTERYASRLAAALRARGHAVHTFAATIDPARPMYSVLREEHVTRVVNNLPGRETRHGGRDAQIEAIFERERARFAPDVVHIQHVIGLSASLPLGGVRAAWTLHDAWAWCAAGGTLLPAGAEAPCEGPNAGCAACASAWQRDTPGVDRALGVGARLGAVLDPARLHRAWKRLPAGVRARVTGGAPESISPAQVASRAAALRELAGSCRLIAPSRWLAAQAEQQGLGPVRVVPHGVGGGTPREPPGEGAPLVFVGTLAWHKGPDLVREGWRRAAVPAPLRVYGPAGPDPRFRVDSDGVLDEPGVMAALRGARALVLGSRWPENAPLVILEARSVGCPVIAPRIGGIPELVQDGVDGHLYRAGDADDLARVLRLPLPGGVTAPPTFDAHVDAVLDVYR